MIEDARRVAGGEQLAADVAIIGGGAAGIALALAFADTRAQVLVLEGGGLGFDAEEQKLYRGRNVGLRYEPLDLCRVKGLGGSTGRQGWAGWCKPLRAIDFRARPWVPLSGWPFGVEELAPYYREAMDILSLPASIDSMAADFAAERGIPLDDANCQNEVCPLSPAPHLGEVWKERLEHAGNMRVLLHANVKELAATDGADHVRHVEVATLAGNTFRVSAKTFVLAAGGIENARLLLLSDRIARGGLGNESGLVGRCFMDHPRFAWGQIRRVEEPARLLTYDPTNGATHNRERNASALQSPLLATSLTLSEAVQEREGILNARSWILPVTASGERRGGRELREIALWMMRHRLPSDIGLRIGHVLGDLPNATAAVIGQLRSMTRTAKHWQFVTTLEPEPNPDSRVMLDDEVDALGLRRVKLDWRLGALTARTLERTQQLIVADLQRAGFDCAVVGRGGEAANQTVHEPRWVWHHMGTTRMSADARRGVVDADCRVHGIDNLFIAGSSIFPTVGNDMPTMTLVALARRLAAHLKRGMGIDVSVPAEGAPATAGAIASQMATAVRSGAAQVASP